MLIDAEGPHFSFGASVEEHLPDQCAAMLRGLHALVLRMVESPVPILVAVRGQCLGGGLELALAGHLMFVAPRRRARPAGDEARRIRAGRLLPAAGADRSRARRRSAVCPDAASAAPKLRRIGLAQTAAADPEQAALGYFDEHLKPKSASSLRFAVQGGAPRLRRARDGRRSPPSNACISTN